MSQDILVVIELTRRRIALLLESLCMDPASRNYGGFVNSETGYADSRGSIFDAQELFAGYLYPDFPEYHRQSELLAMLKAHLQFIKRRQLDDGTVNLGVGYGGGNEVGFTLPGVCETYRRVQCSDVPGRDEILDSLGHYIHCGAEAVRQLFPYTSNHRWTACIGPLAVVDSLFPDERNRIVIEEYLSDGIDMDADGLYYEERSPNYNMVANWGLLYLVDHWGRQDLLKYIERNLRFCLAMRQPCGEAESLFSHRQDRGGAGCGWGDYYLFKRMAIETGDGQFAQAADELLEELRLRGLHSNFIPLRYLFDDERVQEENIRRQPLPDQVEIRCKETPLWRWRKGQVAITVTADKGGHWFDLCQGNWGGSVRSDAVMNYHVGDAIIDAIKIRWGSGTGGFRPEMIEYPGPGKLRLVYRDPGWDHLAHFRPGDKWGPSHIVVDQWAEMNLTLESDGTMAVAVKAGGWPEMPVNVQFLLRQNCRLIMPHTTDAIALDHGGKTFTLGDGSYRLEGPNGGRLRIEGLPASESRLFIGDARTIPGQAEARCHRLVVCRFTPFEFTFRLRPESGEAQERIC